MRVVSGSAVPLATALLRDVDLSLPELVVVRPVDRQGMLSTYEVRLARSLAGEGRASEGLAEFVDQLRSPGAEEAFSIRGEGYVWFGLFDSHGDLVGLTAVVSDRNSANRPLD